MVPPPYGPHVNRMITAHARKEKKSIVQPVSQLVSMRLLSLVQLTHQPTNPTQWLEFEKLELLGLLTLRGTTEGPEVLLKRAQGCEKQLNLAIKKLDAFVARDGMKAVPVGNLSARCFEYEAAMLDALHFLDKVSAPSHDHDHEGGCCGGHGDADQGAAAAKRKPSKAAAKVAPKRKQLPKAAASVKAEAVPKRKAKAAVKAAAVPKRKPVKNAPAAKKTAVASAPSRLMTRTRK